MLDYHAMLPCYYHNCWISKSDGIKVISLQITVGKNPPPSTANPPSPICRGHVFDGRGGVASLTMWAGARSMPGLHGRATAGNGKNSSKTLRPWRFSFSPLFPHPDSCAVLQESSEEDPARLVAE
ncbi:hypothetical protein CDAR_524051 [Caerostris darwini]|uniref:Uncharacterized protein n=1 Tax=Caerostris darwini TaxID=1538125 RepID=A0AAV4TW99_9ARAC|nr:hypothetical protein CDAR_524051 [Caerostris darwini]